MKEPVTDFHKGYKQALIDMSEIINFHGVKMITHGAATAQPIYMEIGTEIIELGAKIKTVRPKP